MIKEAISKIVHGGSLTEQEASMTMSEIMSGEATDAQIAAYITALRVKGETVGEITGSAKSMRRFATPIRVHAVVDLDREDIDMDRETILDTCGTGGDNTCTFNVSTATAIVVAACGLIVAKHGNRSVSSACGSADVLEALGVNVNIPPEKVEECLKKLGIGFLFAPALHGAMKYAVGPRKQIGIRTIFNILGPLTNPAGASAQVLGVYSKDLTEKLASVLKNLGSDCAWVVHGSDGLDEISITGETFIAELKNGKIRTFTLKPEDMGLKTSPLSEIKGGDAKKNAGIVRSVLAGTKGAKRDIVLMNAAAGLIVGGMVKNLKEGVKAAAEAIDSGKAAAKLDALVKLTNE